LDTPLGLIPSGHQTPGMVDGIISIKQKRTGPVFFAKQFFDTHFGNKTLDYGNIVVDEEIIYTDHNLLSRVKNAKVLVLGGGPSLEEFDISEVDNYDVIISCNNFFTSDKLKDIKVDIALVGQGTNIEDPTFIQRIKRDETLMGFEHSHKLTIDKIDAFTLANDTNTFLYLTRYFSRLGFASRAIVLAGCLGAAEISIVGFDGHRTQEKKHGFEKVKDLPSYYDAEKYEEAAIIFWDYLTSHFPAKIINLNEENQYNVYCGIKKHVESEIED